jgi:Tol biopolymer transport system component
MNKLFKNSCGTYLPEFLLVAGIISGVSYFVFKTYFKSNLTPQQKQAKKLIQNEDSQIIFDSNQSGTFGIYFLSLKDLTPKVIYDTPQHEINPDPSPDGKHIVFASGKTPIRGDYFDIWLVDADGSNPRLLAKNGAFPTFHADSRRVIFERGHTQIISVDTKAETPKETIIFDANESEFKGHQVFLPRLSPDGNFLVVTSTLGRRYSNYIIDLTDKSYTLIGYGCEPLWSKNGEDIYWVTDQNKKHITAVMRYNIKSKTSEVLVDNDSPRGIDYFPFINGDETLLLYSAGEKRRDYIQGDYQVFLKDMNTGENFRLTNDTFNHRWPKFLKVRD